MLSKDEFIKNAEKEFRKSFPNGFFNASYGMLGGNSICLSFGIIGDKADCVSGIRDNDPMLTMLWLHSSVDANGNMRSPVKMELHRGGSIDVRSPEGSFLAMSRIKFGYRTPTKQPEKVLEYLGKFWKKARAVVNDNVDNIHGVDKIDKIYLP